MDDETIDALHRLLSQAEDYGRVEVVHAGQDGEPDQELDIQSIQVIGLSGSKVLTVTVGVNE